MQRWDIAWDAARAASKRPLRKPYKPVAAVGAKLPVFPYPGGGSETPPTRLSKEGICVCGYHVCSCERPYMKPYPAFTLQTVVGPLTVRIARPGEVPGTFYFPPEGP